MLFQDNKTTFCFPLSYVSLFFTFYDLKNTEKPNQSPIKLINAKILVDGEEKFTENYNLFESEFIPHEAISQFNFFFSSLLNDRQLLYPNNICFLSAGIKLFRNLFLLLGNSFNEDTMTFSSEHYSVSLQQNATLTSKPLIKLGNVDFRNFISIAKDYNNHLYKQLRAMNIWNEYCSKRNLDITYKPN